MGLPTPILDDRSWQQLRDELVRRIPVYAPEWTDHNPSDPGITLLELVAFLGENLLFRFNQLPEAARLQFLRLLGVPPRTAEPARAMVALTPTGAGSPLVPIGTELRAGSLPFETEDEVRALPVELRAVARAVAPEPDDPEASAFAEAAVAARELGDDEAPAWYVAELLAPDPAEPGFEPLDFGRTVDGTLWLAALLDDPADLRPLEGAVLNVGFVPDPDVPTMDEVDPCPGVDPRVEGEEVVWEVSTPEAADGDPVWRRLAVVGDTTAGLTRRGVVRLRLPREAEELGLPEVDDPLLLGTGDLPPEVDDEEVLERLAFWIRGWRRLAGRPPGRVAWVGANAAEAVQLRTARAELLGTGTGDAGQTMRLAHAPVLPGTLVLQVEEPEGWREWARVEEFSAAGRDDRVYVLDAAAGTVRFGGMRGRPPQIGERVRAVTYRHGGGSAGNVPAGAVTRVSGVAGVKAANPVRAAGGADAETVEAALERVPGEVRRRDRAVTAGDFREQASFVAGVGRAEVLPRFHPPTREPEAAGVVTVVVWPAEDAERPDAPLPDRELLRAVCVRLDARRLVTTELYVVPPTYRKIAVSVGLAVKPGHGVEAVTQWVELALRQYLAPLPPYGPEGAGWPLGRRVHGPELEAAALQVDGVEYLEGLEVAVWVEGEDGEEGRWTVRTPVTLERWEVPELTSITVVEGPPLPAGEAHEPPERRDGEGRATVPVAIPTLREEC